MKCFNTNSYFYQNVKYVFQSFSIKSSEKLLNTHQLYIHQLRTDIFFKEIGTVLNNLLSEHLFSSSVFGHPLLIQYTQANSSTNFGAGANEFVN